MGDTDMTYKLQKLAEPGLNAQGVPMGLVNYMCLNRSKRWPLEQLLADIQDPILPGYESPILWADLALSRPGVFEGQGFLTINAYDWRRH